MLTKKFVFLISLMQCFAMVQCMTTEVDQGLTPENEQAQNLTDDQKKVLLASINVPCLVRFKGLGEVAAVAFSGDGKYIAGGSTDGVITIWNLETKECSKTFKIGDHRPHSLKFSHNAERLAISGQEPAMGMIDVWNINTETPRKVTGLDKNAFFSVFSPDGNQLAFNERDYTGKNNYISVWNVRDIAYEQLFRGTVKHQNAIMFSPSGTLLAAGLSTGTIVVRNMKNNEKRSLEGHACELFSVMFSNDNQHLMSLSSDSFKLWNIKNFQCLLSSAHALLLNHTTLSSTGTEAAGIIAQFKNMFKVLRLQTDKAYTWLGHNDRVKCMEFSRDGNHLVSGSTAVRVWDIRKSNNLLAKLHSNDFTVEELALMIRYANKEQMTKTETAKLVEMGFKANDGSACSIQ